MSLMKNAVFGLLICIFLFYSLNCNNKEKQYAKSIVKELRTMSDTIIMDYGDYEAVTAPDFYSLGEDCRYIFAVPNSNMVGTNELDNAIKLLEFKNNEELTMHTVKKNFMEMVTGPFEFRFLPVWSNKEIAYSQSKGFLIVNIPDKSVEMYTIISGIYSGNIENVSILDTEKRIFVFEIDNPNAEIQGYNKILRVIQFTGGSFSVLSEHPSGEKTNVYTEPWFVYEKKIFIYNDSTTKLEAFDAAFKPVTSTLADAFNKNQVGFRCMREIVVHPTLPFALIVEQGKPPTKEKLKAADALPDIECDKVREKIYKEFERLSLYLFRWTEEDKKKQLVPLVSVAGSVWNSYNPTNSFSQFTFSPDGKWVVFRDISNSTQKPEFVAVPINSKNPLYLGKPIKLGKVMRRDAIATKGTAWTTNPTAFVMSDGIVLYHWNMDKIGSMQRVKVPKNQ